MADLETCLKLMEDTIYNREQRISRIQSLARRREPALFANANPCCDLARPLERHFLEDGCLICRFEFECDKLRADYGAKMQILGKGDSPLDSLLVMLVTYLTPLFSGELEAERAMMVKSERLCELQLHDSLPELVPCDPGLIKTERMDADDGLIGESGDPQSFVPVADHNNPEWAFQLPVQQTNVLLAYHDAYEAFDFCPAWPFGGSSDELMARERYDDGTQPYSNPETVRAIEEWIRLGDEFRC